MFLWATLGNSLGCKKEIYVQKWTGTVSWEEEGGYQEWEGHESNRITQSTLYMYRYIWKYQNKPITTCDEYRPMTTKDRASRLSWRDRSLTTSLDSFASAPIAQQFFRKEKYPKCPTSEFDTSSEEMEKTSSSTRKEKWRAHKDQVGGGTSV